MYVLLKRTVLNISVLGIVKVSQTIHLSGLQDLFCNNHKFAFSENKNNYYDKKP